MRPKIKPISIFPGVVIPADIINPRGKYYVAPMLAAIALG